MPVPLSGLELVKEDEVQLVPTTSLHYNTIQDNNIYFRLYVAEKNNSFISPRVLKSEIGTKAEFECEGDRILWFHNRIELPQQVELSLDSEKLIIQSVQLHHAGDYLCYITGPDHDGLVSKAILIVIGKVF